MLSPVWSKELLWEEKGWITGVGPNSWWHMKCAQHAAHNPKLEKMVLFRRTIKRLKDPPTWLKVATTFEKPPNPTHLPLQEFPLNRYISHALQCHHNGHDGVSNYHPHHCLLNLLFGRRSKKTSNLRVTGLCVGNSPGTGEIPALKASNAENVSIWWRHHGTEISMPGWTVLTLQKGTRQPCFLIEIEPTPSCIRDDFINCPTILFIF